MKKMKKESKLINLRVFAILSVVLGHSIIIYSKSWHLFETINKVHLLDVLKSIISMYQMPLFFSLSGYLFYYTCLKNRKLFTFIKDKVIRLLIPFLFVVAFYLVPLKMLLNVPGFVGISYFKRIFKCIFLLDNVGHLWFCISLFLIFLFYYLMNRLFKLTKKDYKHYILDIFILSLTSVFVIKYGILKQLLPPTALHRAVYYLFYFYVGFCICKYLALGKKDDAHQIWYVPYLALLTGALIIYRINHYAPLIKIVTTLAIIFTAYYIVPSKTNKITEYIDRNSMGMFLFHSPLIYISYTFWPNINPILMVIINFGIFGTFASLITEIIRKTPFKFIIGEK